MQRIGDYAGGQVARGSQSGLFGNRDYMNTPFNSTGFTAKTIQNQHAQDMIDIAALDPGTRTVYPQFAYDDRLFIRGFSSLPQAWAFDNLTGLVAQGNDLSGVERVEIFKGPSALTNGMAPAGNVGGTVNLVPKRATDAPINQITTGYISNSIFGVNADIGRRFGQNNEFGVTGNVTYREGNSPITFNALELANVTLGLDYRGERTRVSFDVQHINRNLDGPQGGAFLNAAITNVPGAPNARRSFYQPWEKYDTTNTIVMGRVEHDITESLTAFAAMGHRDTQGTYITGFPTINTPVGATSVTPSFTRNFADVYSGETGLRWRGLTGPIKHQAVVSYSELHQTIGNRSTSLPTVFNNIYDPVPTAPPSFAGLNYVTPPRTGVIGLKSVAVADVISTLDDKAQLFIGGRHQFISTESYNLAGLQLSSAKVEKTTPAVGLVLRPVAPISLYANYIEALELPVIAPAGTANVGQILGPLQSRQYEVGVKADFNGFGSTLSFFDIAKPNAYTTAATNTFGIDGLQRHRGIEWEVFGEVAPGIRPLGGFMVLDPVQERTANGLNDGKQAVGVARFNASFGLEVDTPWLAGFTVWGRSIYTGEAYLNAANTQLVPSWVRYDVGARYVYYRTPTDPITFRATVQNVLNTNYWMAVGGYLTQNAPRTFLVSTTFNF